MAGSTSGSDAHKRAKIGENENENENENFFFRMWAVVKVILTKGSSEFTTVVDVAGSSSNVNRVGVSSSDRFDDVDVGGMNNIIDDVDFGVMDEPTVEDSPLLRDIITTASGTDEVEVADTSRPVRSCTIRSSPSTSNAPIRSYPVSRKIKLFWTSAEEQKLKEEVELFYNSVDGSKTIPWGQILQFGADTFHPSRTAENLKDKWRNICKAK